MLSSSQGPSKSYAPLNDESSPKPPYGDLAPLHTVTRNGTIVYTKRVSSSASSASGGSADSDDSHSILAERRGSGSALQSESQDTLSGPSRKGKERAVAAHNFDEDGDLGGNAWDVHEKRSDKGKGKEKMWDPERGYIQAIDEDEEQSYPPSNAEEDEGRRIQENLARLAANDMAKRRAARLSRQLKASPPQSPTTHGHSTSYLSRPLSMLSSITTTGRSGPAKRGSLMGLVDGIWSPAKDYQTREWTSASNGLPMTRSPRTSNETYRNPYDQPSPIPQMVISPTSPDSESPFADPKPSPRVASSSTKRRESLTAEIATPVSPVDPVHGTNGFAYVGPGWRGGGGATDSPQVIEHEHAKSGGEKWWHALCSWGNDLDGGHGDDSLGGQAGRTNPFE